MNPTRPPGVEVVHSASAVAPIGGHPLLVFLLQLCALLGLAVLLGRLAVRLGMSGVVGELCAGVVLGPSLLGHLAPSASRWLFAADPAQFHLLDAVGQVGLLLLVGYTGTHIDLGFIRRKATAAARISASGLLLSLGLGIGAGYTLPAALVPAGTDRSVFAFFLGVALAVSAIPVLAKTLMDLGLLHRDIGQVTLCAVMIDDTVGWLLLSVVTALAVGTVTTGGVALSVGSVLLVVACAWLLRPVLRAVLRTAGGGNQAGGQQVAVTALLMLLGAAGAQAAGLEAVFGAFVMGIAVKSTGEVAVARLEPMRTGVLAVLAPIFFATAGLRMDLTALVRPPVLLTGLAVLLCAVIGKFTGGYLGARLSGFNHWEGLAMGAGVNARGVIEVIIAMVGLRLGVLSPEMYTIIVLIAIVTSTMAPPLLRFTMARVEHTHEERQRARTHGVTTPEVA
ncbi:cation:proton antiporter [Actinokineospora sp. PR83]|uniref:cation:proton antiporter n=1 Tax=Actinokineospora sp. PR83 TaxID=2884908 RepID=UPI001F47C0A3|nr:cation:proton antiporter [Actinokineospora sp. PR83]MCG8915248.1 cation:proton antiporter [Actinokineospora sp. PR83]